MFFMNCKEKQVYKNKTYIKYKLSLCKLIPPLGYNNLYIIYFKNVSRLFLKQYMLLANI